MADNLTDIDKLITGFFDCFDNRISQIPDFEHFSGHFVKDSVIGKRTDADVILWSLDEFWQPRNEQLKGRRLKQFHEWETDAETSIFNGIATRKCYYEKAGFLDGQPYAGMGTKCFQLALTPDGWRIIYLLWEDQE